MKIYEATWLALLDYKLGYIHNIQELIDWITQLQKTNPDLPKTIKRLQSDFIKLNEYKKPLFPNVKTEEAKFLLVKRHLQDMIMKYFPTDTNETLREKFKSKFSEAIPGFAQEWNEDYIYRECCNDLIMLFVFLNGSIDQYDEKTLFKLFEIINIGLADPHEIVQAEITRGLLLSIMEKKKSYVKYMPKDTLMFYKKLIYFLDL